MEKRTKGSCSPNHLYLLAKTHKVVILDAPVGAGKSLIATAVSWMLNRMSKRGYILASDITLQNQYEEDFKRFGFSWGSVKGLDNYTCTDNDEKISLGTCHERNKKPQKMYCYDDCPYYSARNKAVETPTSLLNYAYWLIHMNYVNRGDHIIFPPRDFLICDEGHKLMDIVQGHYTPRFDKNTDKKLKYLKTFFENHNIKRLGTDYRVIMDKIDQLWDTENHQKIHEYLCTIEFHLERYLGAIKELKKAVEREYKNEKPPKEWKKALYYSDWVKDLHCKVEDFNDIIKETHVGNIVKNPKDRDELIFNCLEEKYMMASFFHSHYDFSIIMSATFSDPSEYIKSIAVGKAKYVKLDNQFDFQDSPIFYYNKRKMSMAHIDNNLPWLYEKIDQILDENKDHNGIIHTASYNLTDKIKLNLKPENQKRLLFYNGTDEKRNVLDILKVDKSRVLIGPSLLEGIDLKNEWSRFQIFAKVPYMSLGDKFVKAKMNINPGWYRWKAIIAILQGVGRSVRNEKDWARTYILDGSLSDLIHQNRRAFPPDFMQRIQVLQD